MKMIHLSDLHIGKRLNGFSLLDDQCYILEQILRIADREKPDGIIIAGDIYDKPVPPAEAVQLLDEFLTALAVKGRAVFIISGNHDSPERLAFGTRLIRDRGVYISPVYDGKPLKIQLADQWGSVYVHLLPHIKPAAVRRALEEMSEGIATYQDAVRAAVSHMEVDTSQRNILAAHQFVTGAGRCESEEILVGGLDNVDAALFDDFDYVALGHIHSPQHVGRETVRYCGTPLKYSFSEADQEKSVTVAELREKGSVSVRTIPLKPYRDMRKIRGSYMELTARSFYESMNTGDYVHITLTDEEDIPYGLQKLQVIYPNLMRLEYDNRRTREIREIGAGAAAEEKSEMELFQEFYELQNNQPMSEQQAKLAQSMILQLKEEG